MPAPDYTKNQLARYISPTPGDFNKPLDLRNLSEFGKGFEAFKGESVGIGGGALALGAQQLKTVLPKAAAPYLEPIVESGLETFQREMAESTAGAQKPKIATIEDIKGVGDLGDWAAYQAGKGLPQIVSFGAGGIIGRQLAKAGVKKGLKHVVGTEVGKKVAGKVVTQEMKDEAAGQIRSSLAKGTFAGGFIPAAGYEGGAAFGEITGEGVTPEEAVGPATAVAGISGALEFTPLYQMAKKVGMGDFAQKGVREAILKDKELGAAAVELARRAAGAGAVGAAAEGITEGLQELTGIAALRWAQDEELFGELTDDDWSQIANATAAGALLGGGVAGGAGAFIGPKGTVAETEAPVVEPVAPVVEPVAEPPPPTQEEIQKAAEVAAKMRPTGPAPPVQPGVVPGALPVAVQEAVQEDTVSGELVPVSTELAPTSTELAPTSTEIAPISTELVPAGTELTVPGQEVSLRDPDKALYPGHETGLEGGWQPTSTQQYVERLGAVTAQQDVLTVAADTATEQRTAIDELLPEQVARANPEQAKTLAAEIRAQPLKFATWSGLPPNQAVKTADNLERAVETVQRSRAGYLESAANFAEITTNAKGKPFTSRKAATMAAQKRGIENFTVDERGPQNFVVRDLGPKAEPVVLKSPLSSGPERVGEVQMPVDLVKETTIPSATKIPIVRTQDGKETTTQVNARTAVRLAKRRVNALTEVMKCLG